MPRKAFLLALLVAGCGSGGGKPGPQTLVWARGADSATLDPAEAEWGEDLKVVASLYEPLVTFREDLQLDGRLARSWTVAADGRSVSFALREGVRFHDGSPFTAEAVVFTFQRLLDPRHPNRPKVAPYAANFSDIEKVEAAGTHQVVFTLRRASRLILPTLALPGASIVSPAAARAHGAKFAQHPSGTGPYRLARWERDVKMELEAFDGYWGAKPPIPRLVVVPVPSPQTAIQKLRKGEVHVVDHPSLADVKALQGDPTLKIVSQAPMNICCLGFNMKKAPYNDLNFRRAVSLAIDRRALNAIAYHGLAEPAANVVPPTVWADLGLSPDYEFDLAKARECLARVRLDSKEVHLIHVTIPRPYMPEPQRVAEFVKDQLRKIGLELKLTGYDKGAYGLKTREESHPMFLLGWKGDYPDPDNYFYPLLHGDNAGDQNGSWFDDPAFNEAVRSAQTEADPARRKELYARAYRRYREELPTIPLVHLRLLLAVSRKVEYLAHPLEYRFASASFGP